jgi:hypothetical protein
VVPGRRAVVFLTELLDTYSIGSGERSRSVSGCRAAAFVTEPPRYPYRIVSYRIDPAGLAENRARPSRRPVRHRHDDAVRESTRVALSDSHLCDGRATKRTGREGFDPPLRTASSMPLPVGR